MLSQLWLRSMSGDRISRCHDSFSEPHNVNLKNILSLWLSKQTVNYKSSIFNSLINYNVTMSANFGRLDNYCFPPDPSNPSGQCLLCMANLVILLSFSHGRFCYCREGRLFKALWRRTSEICCEPCNYPPSQGSYGSSNKWVYQFLWIYARSMLSTDIIQFMHITIYLDILIYVLVKLI